MPTPRSSAPKQRRERARLFLARAVRMPVVHYLLSGSFLFLIVSNLEASPASSQAGKVAPVLFDAGDIAQLEREWADQHGFPPDRREGQALLDRAIGDEILFREARALGLDREDRVVGNRLVELARFVAVAPDDDEMELERQARSLGFDRSDPVVRHHLVQMMELAASRPLPSDIPTEEDLREYCDSHAQELTRPAQTLLSHVYLSRQRRGAAVGRDAEVLRDILRRTGARPEEAAGQGDPFVRGSRVGPVADAQLQALFGAHFSAAISRLPTGQWAGPVVSAYGMHVVWIHERVPSYSPSCESQRNRVVHLLLRRNRQERLAKRMTTLRKRYLASAD